MLTAFTLALIVGQGGTVPPPRRTTTTGNVVKIADFRSKELGTRHNLVIYLPPDYDRERKRRYPVLYLDKGQNLMDEMTSYVQGFEWRVDENAEFLIRAGLIEPLIIVGIESGPTDREGRYYVPGAREGEIYGWAGKTDDYSRFLIKDLKPAIDLAYRTKPDAKNTALGGGSFGGTLALQIGLKNSRVFGKLIALSPSLEAYTDAITQGLQAAKFASRPKIWMDAGSLDYPLNNDQVHAMKDRFIAQGWKPGRDLWCAIEREAPPSQFGWARRLPSALTALFPRK